jgi:hypothetical protein
MSHVAEVVVASAPLGSPERGFLSPGASCGLLPTPPEASVDEVDTPLTHSDELFDPLEGFPSFEIEVGPTFSTRDERDAKKDLLRLETRGVTSHGHQGQLWRSGLDFKATVASKLRAANWHGLAEPLDKCHTESLNLRCSGCKKTKKFWNRCERFYCPACQPRLASERAKSVEWWTKQIRQPKHVVLTLRNSININKEYVKHALDSFRRLRRMAFAKNWQGGFFRLEVTNEGRGWHLHIHALIDCRFIDSADLAMAWAAANRNTGYIVKVRDAREQSYLQEVTKYAVKGSAIAGWDVEDIVDFIVAFTGRKTFGCFGRLYKLRAAHRDAMADVAAERATCDCGCTTFRIMSDRELEWLELHVGCPVERVSECEKKPVQLELGVIVRTAFNLFG